LKIPRNNPEKAKSEIDNSPLLENESDARHIEDKNNDIAIR
jgi:hypothetical protein